MVDLSSGSSILAPILLRHNQSLDPTKASVLHFVLPELNISIRSEADPAALAEKIINSFWNVFCSVREWHGKLQDPTSVILVWGLPGESLDRPDSPLDKSATFERLQPSLSLLPALSGLLRCMTLELDRPIVLLSTETNPQPDEVRDVTAFAANGAVRIGDCTLKSHRLMSHEPRLLSDKHPPHCQQPLGGHILSLGGARGIVSEMLMRLTQDQGHLSVVGRTNLERLDPELSGLVPQELMRVLINRHRQSGDISSMKPRLLRQEVDRVQRQAALEQHLSKLRQGVKIFDYHTADLSEADCFIELLEREEMEDVEVLISGAGVIQDQSCLTKTRESFDAVLRTKVVPLCVLLCRDLPHSLKTWISFSSIASKSGNPGQADYAAANEFLNTVAHWFSCRHPEIQMRTINWGPWQGSGMASSEVVQAFYSRGLAPVEPDAAARMISQILDASWSDVEVSGVSLQPSVIHRLRYQQSLIDRSIPWAHHALPVDDALATADWRLFFHKDIPYLRGHCKNERAVVPAAAVLCLTADLAASLQPDHEIPLYLRLYVFNGITIADSHGVMTKAEADISEDALSGILTINQAKIKRPHYKVEWRWGVQMHAPPSWQSRPSTIDSKLIFCDREDVYKACLFHSGVMARLCDRIIIDPESNSSWCRARPAPIQEQLGLEDAIVSAYVVNNDLTLIDALLQLLLVQTIETCGFSALPQELFIVMYNSMPTVGEVDLAITIIQVQDSFLEAIGACRDEEGRTLFVMERSRFTISKELLDYPPGISYSEAN